MQVEVRREQVSNKGILHNFIFPFRNRFLALYQLTRSRAVFNLFFPFLIILDEIISDKTSYSKRPYSPSVDTFKDDQKTKARRVENDSGPDIGWSREIDDKSSYVKHGSHSSDHEQYDPSQNEERGRFGKNEITNCSLELEVILFSKSFHFFKTLILYVKTT